MRIAGFSSAEMKVVTVQTYIRIVTQYSRVVTHSRAQEAGFSAKKVKAAGYTAGECIEAGWSVEILKAAGYEAAELREANCSANDCV